MKTPDYSFYTETYRGTDITADNFDRLAVRAAAYLNSIKRCELPESDAVNMAICAIAEEWQIKEQGGEVTSQSVGSWSKSFAVSNKSADRKMFDAARLYIPDYVCSVRWV